MTGTPQIQIVTSDYRGDHAADVRVALAFIPGESVEELLARAALSEKDHVEIRKEVMLREAR